jgi:hypothetical protein
VLVTASGAVPYAALTSAQATDVLSAAARLDPYYDRLWEGGSQVPWGNHADLRAQAAAGLIRTPAHLQIRDEDARSVLGSASLRYDRLAAMAVLDSWRTMTTEMLAAFTGCPRFLDHRDRILATFFATGLTEIGTFQTPFGTSAAGRRANLHRTAKGHAFATKYAEELTETELLWVTGGYPWTRGGTFDRHNLLAAELCLRAAEYCPNIGTILGEKHALYDMLTSPVTEGPPRTGIDFDVNQRRADSVLVRADGARIALEFTANPSTTFAEKVTRWCERIENTTLADTGLFVLFVSGANTQSRAGGSTVDTTVHGTISQITRRYSKATQARIGWVQWKSWFPQRGHVSPEFLSLTCATPTGTADDRWRPVRLLDPTSFEYTPRSAKAARSVIRASTLIGATPALVRERIRAMDPPATRLMESPPIAEPLRRDRPREGTPFGFNADTGEPVSLPQGLQTPSR